MLMLLATAQVYRLVVAVLDMEADGVFVEGAAPGEVRHVEHGVAAADDVERRVEDVCRNGHLLFPLPDLLVLMVRRRVGAVSNHVARGPSFETRACARTAG